MLDLNFVLAVLIGSQAAPSNLYTIVEAEAEVYELVQHWYRKHEMPELISTISRLVWDHSKKNRLDELAINAIVKQIIKELLISDEGDLIPIEGPIRELRVGEIPVKGLNYIFHVRQLRNQREIDSSLGLWRCGWLAAFNVVAQHTCLQDELPPGSRFVLSHREIGRRANAFCDEQPTIEGVIANLRTQAKIGAVIDLFKKEQQVLNDAIALLKQYRCAQALVMLNPDYYLLDVIKQLCENEPNLELIFRMFSACSSKRDSSLQAIMRILIDHVLADLEGDQLRELEGLVVEIEKALRLVHGRPNIVSAATCLAGEDRLLQACTLALGVGNICLETYLEACVTKSIKNERLKHLYQSMQAQVSSIMRCARIEEEVALEIGELLDTLVPEELIDFYELVNECDATNKKRAEVLHLNFEPALKCILALLYSPHVEIQDLITFARIIKFEGKEELMKRVHESNHETYASAIDCLKLHDQSNIAKAIAKLRHVEDSQIEEILGLLEGSYETVIKAYKKLKELDREQMEHNIQRYIEELLVLSQQEGENDREGADQACRILEASKNREVQEVITLLQESPDNIPICVRRLNDIAHPLVPDVIALLEADMLNVEDAIADLKEHHPERRRAIQAIMALSRNLPKIGAYATVDQLVELCNLPSFDLPEGSVHFVGNFYGDVLSLYVSDAIPLDISEQQFSEMETAAQSELIATTIAEDFDRKYVQENIRGAHHFICNINRPGEHWIMASLINIPDFHPILVIMDSLNGKIHLYDDYNDDKVGAEEVLTFLYNNFLKRYCTDEDLQH